MGFVYGKDSRGYINITFLEIHNNVDNVDNIQYKEFFKLFGTEWSVCIAYKNSVYPIDIYTCNNNQCIYFIYKLLKSFESVGGNINEIYFSLQPFYVNDNNDCYNYNFTKWLELMC